MWCVLTNAPISTNDDKLDSETFHALEGGNRHRLRDVYSNCAANLHPVTRVSGRSRPVGHYWEHEETQNSESCEHLQFSEKPLKKPLSAQSLRRFRVALGEEARAPCSTNLL